jgi:hypothetical protein
MSSMPLPFRRRPLVLAALALPALFACGGTDPFAPIASLFTGPDQFVLYPLSTAPALLPSAVQMITRQAVRPQISSSLGLNFDLAFDIDAQNRIRVVPPKLVAVLPAGTPVTGIQIIAAPYDSVLRAPTTGYQYDSATVVRPGQVFVIAAQGSTSSSAACSTTSPLYGKMIVDSVVAAPALGTHLIYIRSVIDPNCGFRSLESGVIPKS